MPQPHPFLIQLFNHPENLSIMDQLPFIPGFDQIQAGHQMQPEDFRRFRNYVFKTIYIHRERHHARVQVSKLYHRTKVEKWIHRFAPLAPDLVQALLPFIKTSCYCFSWSYAELWRLSDTPGARTIHIVKSFSFPYDRWVVAEPALASLDNYMKSRTIILPSREIPADAFTSHNPLWDIECIDCCPDLKRGLLMKEAFIKRAFILPLRGGVPNIVTHAIVFYGQIPNGYSTSGPRRFVEFAAQYIKDCYNIVEEIGEDDGDEVKDQPEQLEPAEEKGIMEACMRPRMGSSQLRMGLRRSQSYVHNLRSLDQEV